MARCEDFPACGHELGCCPDFDESGRQLNMVCVCGAKLPIDSRYSICASCMRDPDDPDQWDEEFEDEEFDEDYDDSMDGDHESGLASAGFGTDEDYGYYGGGEDSWLDGSYEE